jgi:hypothetical protein
MPSSDLEYTGLTILKDDHGFKILMFMTFYQNSEYIIKSI